MKVSDDYQQLTDKAAIRVRLNADRVWAAYALADLSPPLFDDCIWHASATGLVLEYRGFAPPIVLGVGTPDALVRLALRLPAGDFALSWPAAALKPLQARAVVQSIPMWRMVLRDFQPVALPAGLRQLTVADAPAVQALIAPAQGSVEEVDAFAPAQMGAGTFFGYDADGALAAVAGTHVCDLAEGVAGVGNVYVRPDHRRRGLGAALTAAVTAELLQRGIETIVLNVKQANVTAQRVYQRLGYQFYCAFSEGLLRLAPTDD